MLSVSVSFLIRPTGPAAVMVTPDGGIGVVPPNAIDRLIEGPQWDALSGRHGLVVWFNVVANQRHEVNRLATQLLLATSGWSADDVPLLRGPVLVAAKLPSGAPTALSMAHFELLNAWSTLSWRARRTLRHRIAAGN